nr:Inner membrane protein ytfF [Klebsiella pneumoniae]
MALRLRHCAGAGIGGLLGRYALRNARWLRENPHQPPMMWATAQALVTLPVSLAGYLAACAWLHGQQAGFPLPFGPRPAVFITLMLAIAVLCSWVGALCWNIASQRLPTVILGPLIVFETRPDCCIPSCCGKAYRRC